MMNAPDQTMLSAERIDATCDAFEAAWRAGESPAIEAFLGGLGEHERQAAFLALLKVELELHRRAGQTSDLDNYLRRFPEQADEVRQAFAESQGVADTSVSRMAATVDIPAAGQPPHEVEEPLPKTISRFEVLGKIGQGAFGMVVKARDPDLDRLVAIKLPRRGALQPSDVERFLREARAAANMHHPNICPVYEVGTADGRPYIVMSLVPGKSLAEHIAQAKEPIPVRQAVLIVRKLAVALELAHQKGIVHRDLKPANVMLDRERKDVVIMDFGLARMERHDDIGLTASGTVMGTPAYMSPEQARGDQKAIGPATDIYSLGVILHELLTRERPFQGSLGEVLGKILHVAAPGPAASREEVPPQIDAIVRKCMAKDPRDRFQSMRELAEALAVCLKELGASSSLSMSPAANRSAAGSSTSSGDEVLAALALEVKEQFKQHQAETRAAVAEAARRSRIPPWQWLSAVGLFAFLVLAGILFFARTPTAEVTINVNVNLKDPELAFLLDKKPISAAKLASPVELTIGKHELLVYRGDKLERKFHFVVKGGKEPSITFTEKWPPEPPENSGQQKPPVVAESSDGWQTILGGDLTGWTPMERTDTSQDEYAPASSGWEVRRDGEVTCVTNRAGWLRYDRKLTDFELKLEFRVPEGTNSGVLLRSSGTGALHLTGIEVQIVDDRLANGPNPRTGAVFGANDPDQSLLRPDGEWNELHVVCHGRQVRVTVNGKEATDIDLDALPGFKDRPTTGYLGLYNYGGRANQVAFRNIRVHEFSDAGTGDASAADVETERQFAKWILDTQGEVTIRVGDREQHFPHMATSAALPQEPFHIVHLRLSAQHAMTAKDLEPLAVCSEIRIVDLHHNGHLGPEALAPLRALHNVEDLRLYGDNGLGDTALDHVVHLRKLKSLHIQGTGVTDDGIARIAGAFPDLEALNVSQNAITNAALPHLATFPKLTDFNAGVTQITDEGLVHLRGLKLKRLGLSKLPISGKGLAQLKETETLEDLRLLETPVTDEDVKPLESLKNLRKLYLGWTKVTPEGERRLQMALPQVSIEHDYP